MDGPRYIVILNVRGTQGWNVRDTLTGRYVGDTHPTITEAADIADRLNQEAAA